jgi:hypothetical protein
MNANDINLECLKDKAYPEDIESCDDCEFHIEIGRASMIGAQIGDAGALMGCEKGYWKEE